MKKYMLLLLILVSVSACNFYQADLDKMEKAARQHIRYRDADNGTQTNVTYFKALSYEEIPEGERKTPEDFYLCKIYMQGTSSYYNSSRIYNINDTLNCIFNKNKVFMRIDEKK